jgi:hypothetical protein
MRVDDVDDMSTDTPAAGEEAEGPMGRRRTHATTVERREDAAENSGAAFYAPADAGLAETPPAALLLALDRAAKVVAELETRRLSVRFVTGPDDRMGAQVVDVDGNVLRRLPVAQALELLSGPARADGDAA